MQLIDGLFMKTIQSNKWKWDLSPGTHFVVCQVYDSMVDMTAMILLINSQVSRELGGLMIMSEGYNL